MIGNIVIIAITVYYLVSLGLTALFCHIMKNRFKDSQYRDEPVNVTEDRLNDGSTYVIKLKALLFNIAYGLTRYMSIVCGRIPSYTIRNFMYKHIFCVQMNKEAVIMGGCELRSPWNISIGKSTIGNNCVLDGRNSIKIEDNVCLGGFVNIWTAQHDVNSPTFSTEGKSGPVVIKEYAWVASRSTVLPHLIVEEGSVIASGAILTKTNEPYGIYAGVPARKIAERNKDLQYICGGPNHWSFF